MRHFLQFAAWRRGFLLLPPLIALFAAELAAGPVPSAPSPKGPDPALTAHGADAGLLGEAQRARLAGLLGGVEAARERQSLRWLGILVEFADQQFPESYAELFDPLGVLGFPDSLIVTPRDQWFLNLMSQVNDYYRTVSHDAVELEFSLAEPVLSLPMAMQHYGDDNLEWVMGVHRLATEAVAAADDAVDFSAYDLVTFIHAGAGQESDLLRDSPEQIWSGYIDWASLQETFADSIPPDSLLGIFPGIPTADQDSSYVLQRFSIAPEFELEDGTVPPFVLGALGVYVHQLGGYLGLLSLNDYVDPRAQGAGNFDLMGTGLWNALGFIPGPPSAFNRMIMGWVPPVVVDPKDALDDGVLLSLPSAAEGGDSLLVKFPISDREYILAENRDQDSDGDGRFSFLDANENRVPDNGESLYGAEFDFFTTQASSSDLEPGSGMFLWRIDEELLHLSFLYDVNLINGYNDHYGVFLLEADGYSDLSSPGFQTESYGSDYDAFRAAGGPNDLPLTQTRIDSGTLPDTRSAEGAESGWRFEEISAHGPRMSFVARWESSLSLSSISRDGLAPAGDALLADVLAVPGAGKELVFCAASESGKGFVYALGGHGDLDGAAWPAALASFDGVPAGSPAAGDLDADGLDEIVILTEDGRLYAWRGDGSPVQGGDPALPLAALAGARVSPLLFDLDLSSELGPSAEPGLEILVAEWIPGSESVGDSTRLRWFDADGTELHPDGADSEAWAGAFAGICAGDLALAWELAPELRGPEHPAPDAPFFNVCLVDTVGPDAGRVLRLAAPGSPPWIAPLPERSLAFTPGGDAVVTLASADLDADGNDELILEAEGELWFWYPRGRLGGAHEGKRLFTSSDAGADAVLALLPADLDGNGAMEILSQELRAVRAFGADASLLSEWILDLPQTDPAPSYTDPATWSLALRGAGGEDRPLLCTRDGRLFLGRDALRADESLFVGGNLAGSPLLAEGDGGRVTILGLSHFEPAEATTFPEDTLLAASRLRVWSLRSEESGELAAGAWTQGGGNARRTRRAAAAGALDPPGSGSSSFREAYAYPNPAADRVTWRVLCDSPDQFRIQLYDLEGQRRLQLEGASDGFSPWETESALVGLPPGVYFFTIHSERTGRLQTGRLAIIR